MKQHVLDAIDLALIDALRADARTSFEALASKVRLTAPAVRERVARLQRSGVIVGFTIVTKSPSDGRAHRGWSDIDFIADPGLRMGELMQILQRDPFIDEAHWIAGGQQLRVAFSAPSPNHGRHVLEGLLVAGFEVRMGRTDLIVTDLDLRRFGRFLTHTPDPRTGQKPPTKGRGASASIHEIKSDNRP